jgi:alanine-glyoxylate transaminase / serine-glyoxylate transaminase / serine-pyruvate transaminase
MKTLYWDWTARQGPEHYNKYCGTPPEHLLFALRAALDMIKEEGLEHVWRRHQLLAGATHAAVAKWAEGQALTFNVLEPAHRAASITNVLTGTVDPKTITAYMQTVCGVTLGSGIGDLSGKALRIAHMGHVNAPMVLGTLSALEMALQALQIPHGSGGVSAAVAYLSKEAA